jgi:hypothetical protein
MMRKVFSVALLATLACVFGLSANAGTTIDVVWADGPGDLTILPGDTAGGGSRTMNVILNTTDPLTYYSISVAYDSLNGLAVTSAAQSPFRFFPPATVCTPLGPLADNPGLRVSSFSCAVGVPNAPPSIPVGTYNIGTIVWDTSATTPGSTAISAFVAIGADSTTAVIPPASGNIVDVTFTQVLGPGVNLNIVPEPGTASLLGLGLVGLILAGRRSRA